MNLIAKEVEALESLLGLPVGFYNTLLKEDDWSFIIKLSALFEAASTQAVAAKLHYPEIENELARLEQSKKIDLMFKLGILVEEQKKFLVRLSELRNKLVHNISEIKFDFVHYVLSLDGNQKRSFVTIFGHGIKESFDIDNISLNRHDFTLEKPKLAIWVTAQEVLACLNADIRGSADFQKITNIGLKLVERLVNGLEQGNV